MIRTASAKCQCANQEDRGSKTTFACLSGSGISVKAHGLPIAEAIRKNATPTMTTPPLTMHHPICTSCGRPASAIYKSYTPTLIVLVRCSYCKKLVDSYGDEEYRPGGGGSRESRQGNAPTMSGSWMDLVRRERGASEKRKTYCACKLSLVGDLPPVHVRPLRSWSSHARTDISSTTFRFFCQRRRRPTRKRTKTRNKRTATMTKRLFLPTAPRLLSPTPGEQLQNVSSH